MEKSRLKERERNIMDIKTKFDIEERVYILLDSTIVEKKIKSVHIKADDEVVIKYEIDTCGVKYSESILFATKDELVQDLLKGEQR